MYFTHYLIKINLILVRCNRSYPIISLETLGYDRGGRFYEEEDSACPALLEREFHSIHRNVPGLRRAGVDANAIRQVSAISSKYTF